MLKSEMTPADVTAICTAAAAAGEKAAKTAKSVPFTWRGSRYVA